MDRSHDIISEFPNDLPAIRNLRATNTTFNEICDDFELLGRELTQTKGENSDQMNKIRVDVQESYDALRKEIADLLSGIDRADVQ